MVQQVITSKIVSDTLKFAAEVMHQESHAIRRAASLLDHQFAKAVQIIVQCDGNLIVSGVGKSGLIGQKLSATFASTGTRSHFMHAAEAMHGDLGRISRGDVVLLISNSGTTDEVINLAAILRQDSVPIVGITGMPAAHLARLSDAVLNIGQIQEACPYNLAPTASTAATLAIGDALALAVSKARSFSAADFHKRHPNGALGRQLLPVRDILRFKVGKNTAVATADANVRDMLREAEQYPRRCGAVLVTDVDARLIGILTDSDLRRLIVAHGEQILDRRVDSVMTPKPIHVLESDLVKDVVRIIRERRLDEIPVIDDQGRPIGIVDVQDLIALKIIEE